MKRFRLLTLLGLLITAVTGAWADDETVFELNGATATVGTLTLGTSSVEADIVKIHNNVDDINGIKMSSNYSYADGKYFKIQPAEGSFKKGDKLSIAVCFNNSDDSKSAKAAIYAADHETLLYTTAEGINGRTNLTDNPAVEEYVLTQDATELYIGRNGNTATFVTTLKVVRSTISWTDIIVNGDMEGTDLQCFFVKENALGSGNIYYAKIRDGIGVDDSRAIAVLSTGNEVDTWDTQFFVRLPYELPAGTPYKVSFDYKADNAGECDLQCQNEPSEYIWHTIGIPNSTITFGNDWTPFNSGEMTVPEQCDGLKTTQQGGNWLNNFQTISFSLAKNETATRYIIDNVKVEIPASVLSGLTQSPITKEIAQYPTFTLTLSPAPVTKATVTIDDQAATPDENGKIADVEANSSVKLTANDGYMFKKVKVKKTPKE
jgi:hypothetical protein